MQIPFSFEISKVPIEIKINRNWLIINLIGLITFVYKSVSCWSKDDTGMMEDTINVAISWSLGVIPVILIITFVNTIWFLLLVKKRNRPAMFVWVMTTMIWLILIRLDFWIRHSR
jgi:hypothetical protein